jgi:hypothetical protein
MVEVGEILAVGEGVEIIKQNIKLTFRKWILIYNIIFVTVCSSLILYF